MRYVPKMTACNMTGTGSTSWPAYTSPNSDLIITLNPANGDGSGTMQTGFVTAGGRRATGARRRLPVTVSPIMSTIIPLNDVWRGRSQRGSGWVLISLRRCSEMSMGGVATGGPFMCVGDGQSRLCAHKHNSNLTKRNPNMRNAFK